MEKYTNKLIIGTEQPSIKFASICSFLHTQRTRREKKTLQAIVEEREKEKKIKLVKIDVKLHIDGFNEHDTLYDVLWEWRKRIEKNDKKFGNLAANGRRKNTKDVLNMKKKTEFWLSHQCVINVLRSLRNQVFKLHQCSVTETKYPLGPCAISVFFFLLWTAFQAALINCLLIQCESQKLNFKEFIWKLIWRIGWSAKTRKLVCSANEPGY